MKTVHLIGYGPAHAIPVRDLRPGMVRLYNYGYKGIIRKIKPAGNWILYLVEELGTKRTIDRRQKLGTNIPILWCDGCGGPVQIEHCHHEAGERLRIRTQACAPGQSTPAAQGQSPQGSCCRDA